MRVLIVEDDRKLAAFVRKGLEQECYAADVVHDGPEAVTLITECDYDVVLLDLMLPGISGLEVLRKVREIKPAVPVLMMTAKDTVEDVVNGLNAGADDYLPKPFAFAELTARVRALLRRAERSICAYRLADLIVDPAHRTATRGGRKIELSAKEFALLEYLIKYARRTLTRTSIIEHVWNIHFDGGTNVVDVYVNYLRNKIDKEFYPPLIRTIRGVGYMLTDDDGTAA